MSKHQRVKNDFYPTTEQLTMHLPVLSELYGPICEPCAGDLDMAKVLARETGSEVVTADIDKTKPVDYHCDSTDIAALVWSRYYAWTVTNPPFSVAAQILRVAWDYSDSVALLLPINFFEPVEDRAPLLKMLADHMVCFAPFGQPRPRFLFGINPKNGRPYGTDSKTVAWCVWKKYFSWRDLGIESPFKFITHWKGAS